MLLRKCFCLLSASGWDNQAPSRSASAGTCLSPDPNRLFLRSGNLSFPAAELRGCAGRSLTMPCAMAIMFSVSAKNNLSDASSHRAIPLAQKHHAAASRSSFSAARSFYSFGASISPVYSKRPYFLFPGSQVCPFCCYISPCGWAHAMLQIQEESQLADSWFRAPVTPQLPHTPAKLLFPARTSFLLSYSRFSRYLVAPCLPTLAAEQSPRLRGWQSTLATL